MARDKHERVDGRRRCELYVSGDSFIGMCRVNFDAAFILQYHLRMSSHTLENGIGE